MTCQEYQRQIVLSLYEELHEGERSGLETHLSECAGCRQAYEEHHDFCNTLAEDKSAWDFPSDLLVESRRALARRSRSDREKAILVAYPDVLRRLHADADAGICNSDRVGLAFGVYISNQSGPSVQCSRLDLTLPLPLRQFPRTAEFPTFVS